MPNDVERMFASLAEDAGRARLAPAADVRRRADRRLAWQSVAGVAAVAVLVTGVTVGARTVLADPDRAPVVPVESVAPVPSPPVPSPPPPGPSTPAASAKTSPSSRPPSSSSAPSIPDAIPSRAFVQEADWAGDVMTGPTRTSHEPPELCGTRLPSDDLIGVRDSVVLTFRAPGLGEGYVANGIVRDTVTVYRGSGARNFLRDLRDAVRTCPVDTVEGREFRYRSRGPVGAGDESLLIEKATAGYGDNGEPSGTTRYVYLAAVRAGDTVAFVEVDGWESVSAERDDAVTFARAAGRRVAAWRG